MRRSSRLAVPLKRPADVIPHLGKPIHWKQGRSAKALADCWFAAGDVPAVVRGVLRTTPQFAEAELLEAWLERETDLGDAQGKPSQTGLLALLGVGDEIAVLCIEAKVDESFGPLVGAWLEQGGAGRQKRLTALCALLGFDPATSAELRYQLLHRTVAVILEARRFRASTAALVVQSFCPKNTGLADAVGFFTAIGLSGLEAGRLVGPHRIGGVSFSAGWASDQVPAPNWDDFFDEPGDPSFPERDQPPMQEREWS